MKSPSSILSTLDFHPSRALGQNFLRYPEIPEKILQWADTPTSYHVIEVGPGLGALTEALLNHGFFVTAIEKDKRLHDFLTQEYGTNSQFRLILDDALEVDFLSLSNSMGSNVALFSNLPYSISTPLIERFLSARQKIKYMTLLVQEEVALRIVAAFNTDDYGRLSIWIQTLAEARMGPRIPKKAFLPEPKVESRLVQIKIREQPLVPEKHIEGFLSFVGSLFQFRRKMLRKSLALLNFTKPDVPEELVSFLDKRPEQLSIPQLFSVYEWYRT